MAQTIKAPKNPKRFARIYTDSGGNTYAATKINEHGYPRDAKTGEPTDPAVHKVSPEQLASALRGFGMSETGIRKALLRGGGLVPKKFARKGPLRRVVQSLSRPMSIRLSPREVFLFTPDLADKDWLPYQQEYMRTYKNTDVDNRPLPVPISASSAAKNRRTDRPLTQESINKRR